MEYLTQIFSDPVSILLFFLVLLAGILVILLMHALERDKKLDKRLMEVEERLIGQLGETGRISDQQAQRSREELSGNLRGMGDSVTRVMSEMARTQQAQMDSFAGQLSMMREADERVMRDMRSSVEARLMNYEERMDRIGDVLDVKLEKNEERMERIRQTVEQQMTRLTQENEKSLEEMRRTVDDKLNATLEKRLGERFQTVSDRLEQVYRGLGEMQTLASGVGDLKRVLTNVRARGLSGEVQLGALLRQIMTEEQYIENAEIYVGGERVDFAVRLPSREGETVLLPIDAGFPQDTYLRMQDAFEGGNQAILDQLSEKLESELIERAAYLKENFIASPRTTAFCVMFLPIEGLYAEALRRSGLSERLQREWGVTLSGPATLTALLNSLQMGFKTLQLEKRSNEVWALLGAVRGEFVEFADALARTQKRIRQASESIEDATRKSRTLQKRLKGVKALDEAQPAPALEDGDDDDDYDSRWG